MCLAIRTHACGRSEQDSVCGTWEILCRAISENAEELIEIGYPAIGHYKALWAENISKYMLPQKNVSPSFNTFKMALITALKNPVPIYRSFIERFSA